MILTKENTASVNIKKLVDEKITSGKVNELLQIVPTNRKARNLKKEIISKAPNQSAFGINVETLGTISIKLLQKAKSFKQLSEAAATVFIKQSCSEIELEYFSVYKDEIPFGTLDRIKRVISEYKRHGITPGVLLKESETLESSEKLKARDIANIYEKYIQKCFSLNAFEIGDVYSQLNLLSAKEFVANFRKFYPNVDLIIADGFNEFSIPEIEILHKLSVVGGSKLFLSFDYNSSNKYIFFHLDKCYGTLNDYGFIKIGDGNRAKPDEFKNILSEKLFKTKNLSTKIDCTTAISKISAHDREEEVELIANEIKKIITDGKAEPHKICVAFNLVQNYTATVKDIFEKNGLPFNLTDRTPLNNSNPITAVVNFLEIIENDFYFKNIFRALSSGFIDTSAFDLPNLYKISSELKIVAGKENWLNTLNDSIANLLHQGDDEEETNAKRAAFTKALNDIKSISVILKPFEDKLTIKEFHDRFKDFIIDLKLPYKLLDIEIDPEKNIRALAEFVDVLAEIFDLLEDEFGAEKKFPIKFYMDQIRTVCNWARFNVKEKSNYGVLVTSLEEIRGLNFDYLFIGGLIDGDLPTRYTPEIFFSGKYVTQAIIHQTEERYRFYQSLCAWNKKLYLTYPSTEDKRELILSTFLKDFEEVFSISSKSKADYEDTIFSKEDLQIFIGKNKTDEVKSILKDENEIDLKEIIKAIEVDKLRSANPFGESHYTGDLLTGESEKENSSISERLKEFSSKQYSISQLETYAKCPFKFFVERLLGISTIEEPTEDIEAIEMGRLLHSILYEFYSTLRDKKIKLVGCNNKIFKSAEDLIFKIAEKQLETTAFKSPLTFYEKEKVLGLNGCKEESILFRFLEAERNGDEEFIPKYFEVSFGKLREGESDKVLSDIQPVRIDKIRLRGKIDRVEVSEELKSFNIVDYKLSGSKPSFDDLKKGISLQLPVYLYAAKELLKRKFNEDFSPNEIFIYSLKYSIDDFGKDKVKTKGNKDDEIQSVDQLIQKSIEHVKNYIEQISNGKFNLSKLEDRENKICRYCQFRTICRIDDAN